MAKGMAARTDFDPAVWKTLGYFYKGDRVDMLAAYRDDHNALMGNLSRALHQGDQNLWNYIDRTCQSCGTYYLHGAMFIGPDSRVLSVGQDCAAEYFGLPSVSVFRQKEAKKEEERREAMERAEKFITDHPGLLEALSLDHEISRDMLRKLNLYGSLSDRQIELAHKLVADAARKAEEKAEEEANSVPVVEGSGLVITGTVLTTRWDDGEWGSQKKMLVKVTTDEGAYKLWGTVPSAILDIDRNAEVTFTANVTKSDRDESFGFFSRPRKAAVLTAATN